MIKCGNSIELLKTLGDNTINLCITSPPYANIKKYNDWEGIHPDKYVDWILPFIKEVYRVLKEDGSFILNINDCIKNKCRHPYVYELVYRVCKETGFDFYERLFWNKMKGLPLRNRFSDRVEYIFIFVKNVKKMKINIDEMRTPYKDCSIKRMENTIKKRFVRDNINQDSTETKKWIQNKKGAMPNTLVNICCEGKRISNNHIAVYPEKLCDYFIKGFTNTNDKVLDIFAGIGTTGISCKKLNREYILFEKDLDYIEQIKKRLE